MKSDQPHSENLPEFSVVTPSYNQPEWLRLAVASVADQNGVTLEQIVQDAGTPGIEDFLERFKTFENGEYNLKCIIEKDAGMYDAVNRGLSAARADLCAYLNCDEQYLPDTLQRVRSHFAAHPKVDILFGDFLITDAEGLPLCYRRVITPTMGHIRASHLNTATCAMFFRRRVFEDGNRFDPKWKSIGDAVWLYEMLKAGVEVAIYPQLLSVFTLTGANLSIDDSISDQEKQKWLAELGKEAPSPFERKWQILLHRFRKLSAGAYMRRSFEYEIYTQSSLQRRKRFVANAVGGRWSLA